MSTLTQARPVATGSLLLGTVAAEIVAAAVIKRFGGRIVLAAGAVLLGAPALAMLGHESPAAMVSISVARGLGFGLCGVATGALAARLRLPLIFAAASVTAGVLDSFCPDRRVDSRGRPGRRA